MVACGVNGASSTLQHGVAAPGYGMSSSGLDPYLRLSLVSKPYSVAETKSERPGYNGDYLIPPGTHSAVGHEVPEYFSDNVFPKEEPISPESLPRSHQEFALADETMGTADSFLPWSQGY